MVQSKREFYCPNCKQLVERDGKFFPFCSKRCKLIDLGEWASERYKVESEERLSERDEEGSDYN